MPKCLSFPANSSVRDPFSSSRDGGKADKSGGDPKTKEIGGKEKDLWVSNLGSTTRATDLKQIFIKYGKVVGAKVRADFAELSILSVHFSVWGGIRWVKLTILELR